MLHFRRHSDRTLWAWLATLLLISLIGLIAHRADAGEATVTWTHPTQFEDGTALTLAQLAATRIEWGTCSGSAFGTKAGEVVVPAPATTTTISALAAGTWCFRAYSRTLAAFGGLESVPTGVVSKVVPFPAPKPPVLVTVATVAYEVKSHPVEGTMLGRNVGTVPLGTACGVEPVVQSFGGTYYGVPRETVTLTKQPKSAVVVAQCEVG